MFGDGTQTRLRFNTQRDQAASPKHAIEMRSGVARERLFGSVAAWLNNELTRGQAARLTCEWVTDNKHLYLVQVDQEDEDVDGVNPFQLRIGPVHRSDPTTSGSFLRPAEGEALQDWDKLKVLEELWESGATHKPTLFYTPLAALPKMAMLDARTALEQDFRSLIGPDNIIVRTSVRAGAEKVPNLPRTECVDPAEAAAWCLAERAKLAQGEVGPDDLAFVAHRFVPAPAAAWARAEPDNPVVEVHSLWGLPDALQYCPYDIWEVHIPTGFATEYPDYKSNMLIPRNNSGWEYVRIKNELARALSIGRREAVDVATRTAVIAQQLGRACHIMWFVGCTDWDGTHFNLPWYWTEAHVAQKNIDRTSYRVFRVANTTNLQEFLRHDGPRARQALELSPTDLDLMRDTKFIDAVGKAAKDAGVPVILAGSTLAHAYFQLRKQGCAVISPGEKEHSRARRSTVLGKLVRDKIPARITQRQEAEITRRLPSGSIKGFLLSKLLEEALEVRNAEDRSEKIIELADLYEVVLALIHAEGLSLGDVVAAADVKRAQAGGFEEGLVLMQTAILGRDRSTLQESTRTGTQVLGRKISEQEFEIPFTFFGFAEMDQPRSLTFGSLGIRLDLVLKADRIELRASKEAEQLDLPLDLTIGADSTLE